MRFLSLLLVALCLATPTLAHGHEFLSLDDIPREYRDPEVILNKSLHYAFEKRCPLVAQSLQESNYVPYPASVVRKESFWLVSLNTQQQWSVKTNVRKRFKPKAEFFMVQEFLPGRVKSRQGPLISVYQYEAQRNTCRLLFGTKAFLTPS